jgi:hypothetical protein
VATTRRTARPDEGRAIGRPDPFDERCDRPHRLGRERHRDEQPATRFRGAAPAVLCLPHRR